MGMSDVRYTPDTSMSPNANLTLFFERDVGALERLHSNSAASLAEESRMLCRGAITKVLEAEKLLRKNEGLNFADHVEGENRWLDRLATVANQTPRSWPSWGCRT